ncbi:gamma-glutamylcyclotransferase [Marinobacterium sp. D7]|uniref:gamma-glutamylcyclotransferase n=1 Tax=Marinobacterium ramblicola TaxID=2849041 RepID=UPI001C2D98D5|nr:gamma-glutamylcyclotransferase [Marinobacterium ramblicola]MBV1790028.1 gamma-glutamylcyclotransferase [Marinobacterium ramblicola]
MISVVGFGSLLSERSARDTVPGLQSYRLVRVPGYRRIFNKVGIVFIAGHGQPANSLEVSSCSTEPCSQTSIIAAQFECPVDQFTELYEREHRYRWIEVLPIDLEGRPQIPARMCTGYSDLEYRLNKCITDDEYHERVGRHYRGEIWRDDILPFPRYLKFCLVSAAAHGDEVLDNFLDTSFLADGRTPIRDYLIARPELVPSSLREHIT